MAVKFRIRLIGFFRALSGRDSIELSLERPTVREAIRQLTAGMCPETRRLLIDSELDDPRPNALIVLNGKEISTLEGLETRIEEGDELSLIPVSHGG